MSTIKGATLTAGISSQPTETVTFQAPIPFAKGGGANKSFDEGQSRYLSDEKFDRFEGKGKNDKGLLLDITKVPGYTKPITTPVTTPITTPITTPGNPLDGLFSLFGSLLGSLSGGGSSGSSGGGTTVVNVPSGGVGNPVQSAGFGGIDSNILLITGAVILFMFFFKK